MIMADHTSLVPDAAQHLLLQEKLADFTVRTMGGSENPVDLDVTLFLYLAIFFLVWFALHNLVFKPYLAVREKREQGTGGSRAEADAMKQQAAETLASYEQAMEHARREAAEVRAALRSEGSKEQKERLEAAYSKAAEELKNRRQELALQAEQARKDLRVEANNLSQLIVKRLLPS